MVVSKYTRKSWQRRKARAKVVWRGPRDRIQDTKE